MSFTDWSKGSTPLQLAIERGLKPGGNLPAEIEGLDDYTVKSEGDAKAICAALQAADEGRLERHKRGKSPLYMLARLFQDTKPGSEAWDFLRQHGIPLLSKLTRKAFAESGFDAGELLFALKMLAGYGTVEGANVVIEIAETGFASGEYLWSVVLGMFSKGHPEARRLFAALGRSLPESFLAVSLLDAANQFMLDGGQTRHPFDSDPGIKKLETWLRETDPELFSYAISATAALPFIAHARRDELFELALDHPDARVELEAAWASAKLGRAQGVKQLVNLCLNVNFSSQARAYLKELGHADQVPEKCASPDFQATAEFARWLAHPNELGQCPDELEILDQRDLRWPTDGEVKHFWLIKYRVKASTGLVTDDVGVGLVGSMTFCLFSYKLEQRPPEDAYAIHAYWEMERCGITDSNVDDPSAYSSLLQQWTGAPLASPKIIAVSELNPDVNYPHRLVGLAAAKRDGQPGWAVLDGPGSVWYPADEMPEESHPKTVLMIHIGRRLLGFTGQPDRKRFLQKPAGLPPEQIVRAFEKLWLEAAAGPAARRAQLIGRRGLLGNHLEAYLEAKSALGGGPKSRLLTETYERFLDLCRQHPKEAEELFGSWAALGRHFEAYVAALVETGRRQDIAPLLALFAPHWQHNLGYGLLGNAAFKAGRDDLAEKFCLQLKEGMEDWQRAEEMSHLAEIWHRQGKTAEARALLLECLHKMREEGRKANGSDIAFFEERFQNHRHTFLRLFPGESLGKLGLPESTLH